MEFKVINEVKLPEQIFDARFHPKSETNLVAAVTIAGNVYLIESNNVKSKLRKHHKGSSIRKIRFTQDGRMVTIAKSVKIHDLVSQQTTNTLKRNEGGSSSLYSLMPLTNSIISAGDDDGNIFVWDSRSSDMPIFSASDCEEYISDIDGKYEGRRLIVCTSGEGTLTAYDLRANKMIEPQSEIFEAGFQCVKMVEANRKVIIGGEDGAIYIFNHNEWAHTSGKFAISSDLHNRGKCSIDCVDMVPDSSMFLAGCSDGKIRSFTLWPHQIVSATPFCRKSPLESIQVNPNEGQSQMVVCGDNYINLVGFEEKSDNDSDIETQKSCDQTPSADGSRRDTDGDHDENPPMDERGKRLKAESDDYLQVFR